MKYCFLIILLSQLPVFADSQNFQEIAGEINSSPRCMYDDTINDVLYIGGWFRVIDGDSIAGIAKYDGTSFSQLGGGLNPFADVRAITFFNNELYAAGNILTAESKFVHNIARWNGIEWDSVGSGFNRPVYSLDVIDGVLYACGVFDSAGNVAANGLAKWDGNSWKNVYNLPNLWNSTNSNYVHSICKYNNEIYIGGNFDNDTISDIIKYDGNNWINVGGGMHGGMSGIEKMTIYNNKLIVAGAFYLQDGNVGNFIQQWDGNQWSDVGGGTLGYDMQLSSNGQIHDLHVYENKLYVGGVFSYAGGIRADKIAIWDDEKWCGLGSIINARIYSCGFYRDTLYIGGEFSIIDSDTIICFAKWLGGDYVDTCSAVGVSEVLSEKEKLQIFPNPAQTSLTININKPELQTANTETTYRINDKLGREVKTGIIISFPYTVSVEDLREGMYIIILQNDRINEKSKFVKLTQ